MRSFSIWSTKTLPNILEISNKRPGNLINNHRIRNSFQSFKFQSKFPSNIPMNTAQQRLVDMGILEMLKKKSFSGYHESKSREISEQSFSCREKRWDHRPLINLKLLNIYIPYHHLNMESLHYLISILQEEDYICELDLKDAYFSIPLYNDSRKIIRCQWLGNFYEFPCLWFGLILQQGFSQRFWKIQCRFWGDCTYRL